MRRHTGQPHLEYRPGGFLWRRRYPTALRFDPPTALRFGLHTHDPVTARDLATCITRLTDLAFEYARVSPMQHADMHHVITELVRWKLHEEDRRRTVGDPRSPAQASQRQREFAAAGETLRQAILLRDYAVVRDPIRHMLGQLGVSVEEGSPAWRELAHETARALIDTTEEIARRDRGEFDEPSVYFRSARGGDRAVSVRPGPAQLTPVVQDILSAPARPEFEGSENPAPVSAKGRENQESEREAALPEKTRTETLENGKSMKMDVIPPATPGNSHGGAEVHSMESSKQAPENSPTAGQQIVTSSKTVSEAYDEYLDLLREGKTGLEDGEISTPGGRTDQQMENDLSTAKFVKKFIGDKRLSDITKADCMDIFEVYQRLPNNYGRSRTESRHPRQIVADLARDEKKKLGALRKKLEAEGQSQGNIDELVAQEAAVRMSANTIYRKMQELKRFFEFAVEHEMILRNPMRKVIWNTKTFERRKRLDGDRARKIWGQKLPVLLRTPHFQDFSSRPYDPLIWACLIAIFSGARQQEILQLKITDFDCENGIHYFHVRAGSNQHVKTGASVRIVPIHDTLIELGLLDLLESRRRRGEIWLFAGLERDPHRNKFSTFFSEEFTKFRRDNGLYQKLMDFHSFRKGINQQMLNLYIDAEVRKALLGHANHDVNNVHYSDGIPLSRLHEAVNAVQFDVSMLRNPFTDQASGEVTHLAAARERTALVKSR